MLHGVGMVLLFTPVGQILIGLMMLLCMAAHGISKACVKVPREALVCGQFRYFPMVLISVAIGVGVSLVMVLGFSAVPWMNDIFSEWGVLYEKALPQAIIFYVLWGIAFYFAMYIQKRSIIRRFAEEYRETGRTYANSYILISAIFAFLMQFIALAISLVAEVF